MGMFNVERSQIMSGLEKRKYEVSKDKYLAAVSPHPPRQEFVSNWLILNSQNYYAISISQSRNNSEKKPFLRHRTQNPHVEARTFFSLEFSYALHKKN
jgi:hypothetical protein